MNKDAAGLRRVAQSGTVPENATSLPKRKMFRRIRGGFLERILNSQRETESLLTPSNVSDEAGS